MSAHDWWLALTRDWFWLWQAIWLVPAATGAAVIIIRDHTKGVPPLKYDEWVPEGGADGSTTDDG